jgi:hypothetical protein
MNWKRLINTTGSFVSRNLPAILTGVGLVGVGATAFFTGTATLKCDAKLKELKAANNGIELTTKEKIKTGIKYYIPAILAGLGTAACIIGANRISAAQLATMVTVAKTTEKALVENREKVKELLGEKSLRKVDEGINRDAAAKFFNQENVVYETGHGHMLCCDGFLTGILFRASPEWIKKQRNDYNARVIAGEKLCYNDFIEMCVPTVDPRILPSAGYMFGHDYERKRQLLEIVEDSFYIEDFSEPGYIFKLRELPLISSNDYYIHNYDEYNGYY